MQHRGHGIFRRSVEQQLAGGVAAGIGQGINFAGPDIRRQRQHAAQHFAQRRAVVIRYPARERKQRGVEHRRGIDQSQHFARRHRRSFVVTTQHHAGHFARTKRNQHAASGKHAVAQRQRQRIRKRLVERNRQTDIAVEKRAGRHSLVAASGGAFAWKVRRILVHALAKSTTRDYLHNVCRADATVCGILPQDL